MERGKAPSSSSSPSESSRISDPENAKVVEWEDFEQELARLWSLSSALEEAKHQKETLKQKLDSLIQVLVDLIQYWRLYSIQLRY